MPLRTILILIILAGIALFAAGNWSAFTAPATLRFGIATVDAPLGLIMLAVTAGLVILFLAFVVYLQTAVLFETRRHAKELQAQRDLAEQAEASRYHQLRQYLEKSIAENARQTEQTRADVLARMDQLDRELRAAIEQAGNTLSAYIGEVEDLLQRRGR
jgi:uncharacterized integral membrane protein